MQTRPTTQHHRSDKSVTVKYRAATHKHLVSPYVVKVEIMCPPQKASPTDTPFFYEWQPQLLEHRAANHRHMSQGSPPHSALRLSSSSTSDHHVTDHGACRSKSFPPAIDSGSHSVSTRYDSQQHGAQPFHYYPSSEPVSPGSPPFATFSRDQLAPSGNTARPWASQTIADTRFVNDNERHIQWRKGHPDALAHRYHSSAAAAAIQIESPTKPARVLQSLPSSFPAVSFDGHQGTSHHGTSSSYHGGPPEPAAAKWGHGELWRPFSSL
jgi:hypothetical protein